jgi:hypothetical protein
MHDEAHKESGCSPVNSCAARAKQQLVADGLRLSRFAHFYDQPFTQGGQCRFNLLDAAFVVQ